MKTATREKLIAAADQPADAGDEEKAVEQPGAGAGAAARRKRVTNGIYRDGPHALFVPAPPMWKARCLFADERYQRSGKGATLHGEGPNARAIAFAVSGGGVMNYYLALYGAIDWYARWQRAESDAPPDVRIASAAEVERANKAWHYAAVCPDHQVYEGFFRGPSRLPNEQVVEFLLWLYGGDEPAGWLILPEWVYALRNELTLAGLCRGAGIARCTVKEWRRDPVRKQALSHAIAAARAGRDRPEGSETWKSLFAGKTVHANTLMMRDSMMKLANAARETEAIGRVRLKLGSCGRMYALRGRAKELGLLSDLQSYVNEGLRQITEQSSGSEPGGAAWTRRGIVGPRVFVPTPPMWDFREKASRLWGDLRISAIRQELAAHGRCFDLWFLDWTLPLPKRLRASAYRASVGLLPPPGRSPYRNDPSVLTAGSATPPHARLEPPSALAAEGSPRAEPAAPPGGWQFPPSKVVIGPRMVKLTGMQWELLKKFYETPRHLTVADLLDSVWHGYDAEEKTVRSTMTHVRNAIRRDLVLGKDYDPLPNAGKGKHTAWEIEPTLRDCSLPALWA